MERATAHPTPLCSSRNPWIAPSAVGRLSDAATVGAVRRSPRATPHATYRQIETLLVVVGLLAMLLAFGVSYPLSRRLLAPLRRLATAAEAARRGDYEQKVTVSGDDEVARLARSLQSLLADLREKRDMERYLGDIAHNVAEWTRLETPPWPPVRPRRRNGGRWRDRRTENAAFAPGSVVGRRYEIPRCRGLGRHGIVYRRGSASGRDRRAQLLKNPKPG